MAAVQTQTIEKILIPGRIGAIRRITVMDNANSSLAQSQKRPIRGVSPNASTSPEKRRSFDLGSNAPMVN